ncbi:BRO family protein [Clostridium sp.]|uniref:BRO family protein n=1 Tax=Clostridium sp. TaxID=1506 RepID=UPI003217FAF8
MKHYTVAEVAKKLRVSDNAVYDRVRSGEITKVPNMGRIVRIPSTELKKFNRGCRERDYFTHDENKVEVIETHLGKVRKVKGKDEYVLVDLVKALGLKDTYSIVRRIDGKLLREINLRKIDINEANDLGLTANQKGLILISYKGIEIYSKKSRSRHAITFKTLLKELKDKEEVKEEIEINTEQGNSNIKVFSNNEFGEIRIINKGNQPWFVGKDVAETLGYQNGSKALIDHVDEEDKLNNETLSSLGQRGGWLINESGLYSLILSSKLPQAKAFKRWVTDEVLPTIRKTGGYVNNNAKFVDNYFGTLSKDTREIILAELESKNKTLIAERVKIDKELLDNKAVIEKIQETL